MRSPLGHWATLAAIAFAALGYEIVAGVLLILGLISEVARLRAAA